jgi:HNH endonuclease
MEGGMDAAPRSFEVARSVVRPRNQNFEAQLDGAMAICIYCKEDKPKSAFIKAEHVLPQSFGKFNNNLTLNGVVCDECNSYYGNELELYLGRDTLDGLNRFRLGFRAPKDYKSLGPKSSLAHRTVSGFYAGAHVRITGSSGDLLLQPLPQVGFAKQESGPYKWYLRESLPSKEELSTLFAEGYRDVHFCEIKDPEAVLAELRERGAQTSEMREVRQAGHLGVERFESKALLGEKFSRCIAKLGFNYLASQYGAATARMPQFDVVRR